MSILVVQYVPDQFPQLQTAVPDAEDESGGEDTDDEDSDTSSEHLMALTLILMTILMMTLILILILVLTWAFSHSDISLVPMQFQSLFAIP